MTPTPAHERLAALMDHRRQLLGRSWRVIAGDAGIAQETLRAVRRGDNDPSTLTRRGLERALRWESGSIDLILSGGEPMALPPDPTMDEAEALMEENERLVELLERTRRLNDAEQEAILTIVRSMGAEANHGSHGTS